MRAFQERFGRMRTDSTSATSAIFAANRARGSVSFRRASGRRASPAAAICMNPARCASAFPRPRPRACRRCSSTPRAASPAAIGSTSRLRQAQGTRLAVTTAAAEKIYRAAGPAAAAQYLPEGSGGLASRLAAAGDHSVRPGAGVAADRYRSGGERFAPALRNRGVRPRRDGRAHATGRVRRPLAAAPRRPAGVCGKHPARRRHRRKAQPGRRSQRAAWRSAPR